MTMGERIKRLRKKEKMSQEELGKYLGVGKTAIHKYENGDVENIPRSAIIKMAMKFNVSPEYILAFNDDEKMGYMTDVMIKEYLLDKYGSDTVRFFEKFSTMTDGNRNTLFGICEVIEKAEKYVKIMEYANQ